MHKLLSVMFSCLAKCLPLVFGLVLAGSTLATAATMTFVNLPPLDGLNPYSEDGITATPSQGLNLASATLPSSETAHLDDGGTGFTNRIIFTMDLRFDAVSFDLLPLNTQYCINPQDCLTPQFPTGDPYDNVLLQGSRNGVVVAEDAFFAGTSMSTHFFGKDFTDLDELLISAVVPDFSAIGGACFDFPCGHFEIDNVTLSPIPLPASAWLLLTALGGIGLAGFRRRWQSGKAA